MGPDALLTGRNIGQDFAAVDGWNMYHGSVVPGFPQHPHRGFETVTFVRRGLVDHHDSMGAAARFGRGDVQWLTAGAGIVHSEMFPLIDEHGPNPLELFQIWLNLPASDKMVDPYFTMLWDHDIPRHVETDDAGLVTAVTVIAGRMGDRLPPAPPPNSWASRADADLAIWHIVMEADATWQLPRSVGALTNRTLYLFEGDSLDIGGHTIGASTAAVVDATVPVAVQAGPGGAEILLLQARPIAEPVSQYGPFVMNTRSEIEQAFADYRRTGFGGWPWPADDPVNPRRQGRFARHADGRVDTVDQPGSVTQSAGTGRNT